MPTTTPLTFCSLLGWAELSLQSSQRGAAFFLPRLADSSSPLASMTTASSSALPASSALRCVTADQTLRNLTASPTQPPVTIGNKTIVSDIVARQLVAPQIKIHWITTAAELADGPIEISQLVHLISRRRATQAAHRVLPLLLDKAYYRYHRLPPKSKAILANSMCRMGVLHQLLIGKLAEDLIKGELLEMLNDSELAMLSSFVSKYVWVCARLGDVTAGAAGNHPTNLQQWRDEEPSRVWWASLIALCIHKIRHRAMTFKSLSGVLSSATSCSYNSYALAVEVIKASYLFDDADAALDRLYIHTLILKLHDLLVKRGDYSEGVKLMTDFLSCIRAKALQKLPSMQEVMCRYLDALMQLERFHVARVDGPILADASSNGTNVTDSQMLDTGEDGVTVIPSSSSLAERRLLLLIRDLLHDARDTAQQRCEDQS